jgi:hypothetical protein
MNKHHTLQLDEKSQKHRRNDKNTKRLKNHYICYLGLLLLVQIDII